MADWLADPLSHRFLARGLAIALLLGVAGGLVGCVLLLRRIVLIADSFGHALLPGIGLAYLWFGPGHAGLFAGAAVAGLGTAVASGLLTRLTRLREDAAFACLFVVCMAVGVILMSRVAAPVDLMHYLFGNVLAATALDLSIVCAVACATVVGLAVAYRPLLMASFDPDFHRAAGGHGLLLHLGVLAAIVANLVAALSTVGMVLALGIFVLPAAIAYLWCERFGTMLVVAAASGGLLAAAGLLASWQLDLPSGACMVGALGAGWVASLLLSPRHGLLGRLRRRHYAHDHGEEVCAAPGQSGEGS